MGRVINQHRDATASTLDEWLRDELPADLEDLLKDCKQIITDMRDGCSTHPEAEHGFNRTASHTSDEYVCMCAGFDPYEAGYERGFRAGMAAAFGN